MEQKEIQALIGKKVMIRDQDQHRWDVRILVAYNQTTRTPFVCVVGGDEERYRNLEAFTSCHWNNYYDYYDIFNLFNFYV